MTDFAFAFFDVCRTDTRLFADQEMNHYAFSLQQLLNKTFTDETGGLGDFGDFGDEILHGVSLLNF